MTALATIAAHDMQPLVDDATVEARWKAAVDAMSGRQRAVPDLIESVQREADEIEQNSKAAARCGGQILRSRAWRFLCLQDILRELEALQAGAKR